MSNSIYVSYSSASRYKSCPQKFYLSKRFQDRRISSALPFGKAIEMGVSAMLEGKELGFAQDVFQQHWTQEHVKGNEYRQIFDNLDLQFYASDFDKNLYSIDDEKLLDEWADEILDEKNRGWLEVFDAITSEIKADKPVSDAQLAFYNRVIWSCCRIRGLVMLEAFHNDILPRIDLTKREHFASQLSVSMENSEGDKITGFIDYVVYLKDFGWTILDLKTAGAPYSHHNLNSSEQLKVYVASEGSRLGANRAGYCVLLKKIKVDKSCNKCDAEREGQAKKCKRCGEGEYSKVKLRGETQLMVKEYEERELDEILDDYMNVAVAIKNEVTYKNPASCNNFGRACEFMEVCWGKKRPEDVDYLEKKEGK